jgi:glycosyltransferase involved in cell wall biosynthesis
VREVVFAIPGDIATPTGGYKYDREVLARLQGLGIAARHVALPGSFPSPTADDLAETRRLLSATAPDAILLIDGLAYGIFPVEMVRGLNRAVVALVHHPLGYETGLSEERARALVTAERAALSVTRKVIVTSPVTRRLLMAEFGVPADHIAIAEPGTDPAERAEGTGDPVALLAVGAVSARKGYPILIEALATLSGLPWHLTIAGARDRNPAAGADLDAAIARHGLADRVTLIGAVDQRALADLYAAADIFVMPSLFEGYGMVLGEAMARGLPIVCTTGGAAAETVPDGAGIKVPPGDAAAFGGALRDLLVNLPLRQRLAAESWQAGQRLPRWDDTARRIADVLKELAR